MGLPKEYRIQAPFIAKKIPKIIGNNNHTLHIDKKYGKIKTKATGKETEIPEKIKNNFNPR